MTAEALADVKGGDVTGPDTKEEKQEKGYSILFIEYLWKEHERIRDVDEHQQAGGGLSEDTLEPGGEYDYCEEHEGSEGDDGEDVGRAKIKSEKEKGDCGECPPERHGIAAGACEGTELQCSEAGNDGGEDRDHPEFAEKDQCCYECDQYDCCEDSLHVPC